MKDTLIGLIKKYAITYGDYILASGKHSSYYLDIRQVTLESNGLYAITEMILDILPDDIQAIGGMSIGADPIIGGILVRCPYDSLAAFIVRKESKDHGMKKLVEGPIESGMNVIIVEDVATTGASALAAADVVIKLGCTVKKIIAVVDRLEGAREQCETRNIAFESLITIHDLGILNKT